MLSKLFSGLKRRRQARQRSKNLAAVEKLGFKHRLLNALGQPRRYVLEDVNGRVFDNNGHGFSSSVALLEAAEEIAAKSA